MDTKLEVNIRQVQDGFVYEIKGPHKLGGERVCKNTEEFRMLEVISEVVTGFKCKVERR